MTLFAELGLRPVINAVGPTTRLGGLNVSQAVWAASREAAEQNVRMDELQEAAGQELARLLGAPAVYVTNGAAAALTLATAVAVAGDSPADIDSLPSIVGPRRRVVIQHSHRDPYDHAVTAVGVTLTEIGFPGSTRPDELSRELDDSVAAVLWRPGKPGDLVSLADTASISHRAGVPVIVDAAMDVPPTARLASLLRDGADLIAISGGKGFLGPQTSGMLCGRPDLIAAAALHHQDMDVREETLQPSQVSGLPLRGGRHGIARGMKVGREQVAGLVTAVRLYVESPERYFTDYEAELSSLESELAGTKDVQVRRSFDDHLYVPVLEIDFRQAKLTADDAIRRLQNGTPRIYVAENLAWQQRLVVNPMGLLRGQGREIACRVVEILRESRSGACEVISAPDDNLVSSQPSPETSSTDGI